MRRRRSGAAGVTVRVRTAGNSAPRPRNHPNDHYPSRRRNRKRSDINTFILKSRIHSVFTPDIPPHSLLLFLKLYFSLYFSVVSLSRTVYINCRVGMSRSSSEEMGSEKEWVFYRDRQGCHQCLRSVVIEGGYGHFNWVNAESVHRKIMA